MNTLTLFLAATVRTALPLLLAAFGELLVERTGIINVGLEGVILAGSFGALLGGSSHGLLAGYAVACLAGALVTALFAVFVIYLRADQIITGTAVTLLSIGLTGFLYRALYGQAGIALSLPTSPGVRLPVVAQLPVLGEALFSQPFVTYVGVLSVVLIGFWMRFTYGGLALRAIGEFPEAAVVAGIPVQGYRAAALLTSGVLGGLAGGTLVLAQAGTFVEGMSAGRGFIAIAIVVLGRWNPAGVALAALFFGAAGAAQFLFQSMGWRVPYQLFLVLPYLATLGALAGARGRARAPGALGKPVEDVVSRSGSVR